MDSKDLNDKTIDMLHHRMKKLEEKIVGNSSSIENRTNDEDVITQLLSLEGKLGNALSTRDRMMMVMKRLDELERYLDPTYGESHDLSDNVKMDLILAQEERLHEQHQQLQSLNSLKQCLSFDDVANSLQTQNAELLKLWQKHEETEKFTKEQSEKISQMFENYNSIIMTLTDTFVRMNDIVTKAEVAAMPKKVTE